MKNVPEKVLIVLAQLSNWKLFKKHPKSFSYNCVFIIFQWTCLNIISVKAAITHNEITVNALVYFIL